MDYIDDGYEREDGYIAAANPATVGGERLFTALEFTYRSATRTEVIRHDAEVRNALLNENSDPECAVKAEMLACAFVAKRVKRWSLMVGSRSIAVSPEACSRMHAGLFGRLYSIVRNTSVSDPKPPATEPPATDEELQKN